MQCVRKMCMLTRAVDERTTPAAAKATPGGFPGSVQDWKWGWMR